MNTLYINKIKTASIMITQVLLGVVKYVNDYSATYVNTMDSQHIKDLEYTAE